MPELPEVERGRRIAESAFAGRTIVECHVADDDIVYEGVPPKEIVAALKGRKVLGVHRRGKHLFFELDERPWPLFHFGMTGAFCVPGEAPLDLATGPVPDAETWPPRFTKIELVADDGSRLAMTNARRLGRIRLRDDPLAEAPLSKLGFDPLLDLPDASGLSARLSKRKVAIKSLLLDQGFAAGIGNWMADEILYQAHIAPTRRANELSGDEAKALRSKIRSVTERAVDVNAEKDRLPRSWLFHHRWGKVENAKTSKGEAIEHLDIGGRTTAWVPEVQR